MTSTETENQPRPLAGPLPAVSVVIATHHRPELLRLALAAVLDQDYRGDIECLLVFDQCPPDESLRQDLPGRTVRVAANGRTAGLAGARNTGILAAGGVYVAFCDDDDVWLPGKLSTQVRALMASGALTCVSGITVQYSDHETIRVPTAADLTLRQLVQRRVMEAHPSTVVVLREALLGRIGMVDEDIPGSYGEDFDWILRAVQAGPIEVVAQPLVNVRWGGSLFSQRWDIIIASIDYGIAKHAVLRSSRIGLARLYGRKSFALAALGKRREALRCARQTVRLSWRERRAYLAAAVALRLISADRLVAKANSRGHGI